MRGYTRRRVLATSLSLASLAFGPGRPANAQARPVGSITMGLGGWTAAAWPEFISIDKGLFAANNVKVDLIASGTAAAMTLQLVTGALDVADISAPQIIQAINGGAPIVAFSEHSRKPAYLLIGRKGLSSVAQLKGKSIIVAGPTDITRLFTDKMLSANNLTPDDYSYYYAAASGERYAGLINGAVDAAILAAPFSYRAVAQGYPVLDDVSKYFPSFVQTAFVVRTAWAQEHSDLLIAFTKGYLAGIRWLYDPANKVQAIQILSDRTNTSVADATATYDEYVTKLHEFTASGLMANESLVPVLDALVKIGQLKPPLSPPTRYYDNRWVRAAQRG